jgi:hypothetical protein
MMRRRGNIPARYDLFLSTHDQLNEFACRGHGSSYRYHVYVTPRLDLIKCQMTWNRFSGFFFTFWSNAAILQGKTSKKNENVFDQHTDMDRNGNVTGGKGKLFCLLNGELNKTTSMNLVKTPCREIIEDLRTLFRDFTSISRHMRVSQTLRVYEAWSLSEIHEFKKLPRTLVRPNGYWR